MPRCRAYFQPGPGAWQWHERPPCTSSAANPLRYVCISFWPVKYAMNNNRRACLRNHTNIQTSRYICQERMEFAVCSSSKQHIDMLANINRKVRTACRAHVYVLFGYAASQWAQCMKMQSSVREKVRRKLEGNVWNVAGNQRMALHITMNVQWKSN